MKIVTGDEAKEILRKIREEEQPKGMKVVEGEKAAAIMEKIRAQDADQSPSLERDRLTQEREQVGKGQNLRVGPFDTGIEMPQGATEFLAGAGRRLSEIGTLGTHKADPRAAELLDDSGYATAGGVAADMAAMTGGAALAPAKVAGVVGAVTTPKNVAQAVAGGAAYGAATSNDRASGALAGGIGGGIGQGAVSAAGKIIKPMVRPGARELVEDGVPLTAGQVMGGTAQRLEDILQSTPVAGDMAIAARTKSLAGYNRKLVNDALSDIGEAVDDRVQPGRDMIQVAQDKVSRGYESILNGLDVRKDDLFESSVDSLGTLVQKLPKQQRKAFKVEVDEVMDAFDNPNNLLLGKTFKEVDSNLRKTYKKLLKSEDPMQARLGSALRQLHDDLLGMAKRQHPEKAAGLENLDRSYAKLSVIEEAATGEGAKEGVFTPSHLLRATKKRTDRKSFAAGRGFGQKEAELAKDIFSQKIPDSGTASRAIPYAVGAGAASINPSVIGAAATGAAMYTQPGQQIMRALLMARPKGFGKARELLDLISPYTGRAGTAVGVND